MASTTTTMICHSSKTIQNNESLDEEKEETRISDLPSEILIGIISNLSLNTIKNCIQVCQQWQNLIIPQFSNLPFSKLPECFIVRPKTQLNKELPQHYCYLVDPEEAFQPCKTAEYEPDDRNHGMTFDYDFGLPMNDLEFVNSCNGFICLMSNHPGGQSSIYILNPITGDYVILPQPPMQEEFYVTRFGYVSRTNEYKVFQFQFKRPFIPTTPLLEVKIAVHTLGTNKWKKTRRLFVCMTLCSFNLPHFEAVVNGSLHWIIRDDRDLLRSHELIASFNYDHEQLKLVPPPFTFYQRPLDREKTCLGVINGCLSVCTLDYIFFIGVFVMKDYGEQSSWIKLLRLRSYGSYQPLKLLSSKGCVIVYDGVSLASRTKKTLCFFEKFEIYGINAFQVILYTPSFVSFRDIALGENLKIFRIKS